VVPGGGGGGIPGRGGCTALAFAFFTGRGLAIQNHAPESNALAGEDTSVLGSGRLHPGLTG